METINKWESNIVLTILFLSLMILFLPELGAQKDSIGQAQSEIILNQNEDASRGFIATFVRTPFALFCFAGVLTGVIFSAIIEFLCNLFSGFDYGYDNTSTIWKLGWNQLLMGWYWAPSVWWHVLISVIVWGPLLNRKKESKS